MRFSVSGLDVRDTFITVGLDVCHGGRCVSGSPSGGKGGNGHDRPSPCVSRRVNLADLIDTCPVVGRCEIHFDGDKCYIGVVSASLSPKGHVVLCVWRGVGNGEFELVCRIIVMKSTLNAIKGMVDAVVASSIMELEKIASGRPATSEKSDSEPSVQPV